MSKVIVTAKDGQVVITSSNNPEFGYLRVASTQASFNDQGFVTMQKRSALIRGKVADLEALNLKEGQTLAGKIVIIESTTPTNENDPEQDLKVNPKTEEVLTHDGSPIYRVGRYSESATAMDTLLKHDTQETSVAQAASGVESAFAGK